MLYWSCKKPSNNKEIQAMSHHNTIFSQILKLVPRHEFNMLAKKHDGSRRSDAMNRWTQFVAMSTAQLVGRASLRDIETTIASQNTCPIILVAVR